MNRQSVLTKIVICLCVLFLMASISMAAPRTALASTHKVESRATSETSFTKVNATDVQTLDPHMAFDTTSFEVTAQGYETLLTYQREDPETLIPLLAQSWEVLDDGTTYAFSLRRGIAFHEAGTLEAHDVAYSFWRGLLQDYEAGPMFMITAALLGVDHIDDLPGDDPARCQMVKDAITFDDEQALVFFHLQAAYGPLPSLLASSYAAVLDQEWMAANGDWDGSCLTWRDWYNPAPEDSILYAQMNGTGPFQLESWVSGEVHLIRNPHYWRVEPVWPGGSSGLAEFEDLFFVVEVDPIARGEQLINGTADAIAYGPGIDAQLDPYLWGIYDGYNDRYPDLADTETGILKKYANLNNMRQYALLFNYEMVAAENPFILSGALDGSGIPPDFFSDIHVRKAFNHAVDWDAVINTVFGGQAHRAQGPIPKGEIGFDPALENYAFDLALAEDELRLAFNGDLWTNGFMMILPVWGNQAFVNLANQLANNLKSIAPEKIDIQVVQFTYDQMIAYRNAGFTPFWYAGWMEDYHHPHNWVLAYLFSEGSYGRIQHFPASLASLFDGAVDFCVAEYDIAAMIGCYQNLQGLSHSYAAAMWGVQTDYSVYTRAEVRGFYNNPAVVSFPFYELSKGAIPTTHVASPGSSAVLDFDFSSGSTLSVLIPSGALAEMSAIVFTPDTDVDERTPGGLFASGLRFDLMVCPGYVCDEPYFFGDFVTLTLHYTDADIWGLIEDELYLYVWDGIQWVDIVSQCSAGLMTYVRDPVHNSLGVPVCHFSRFVMNGGAHTQYLPILRK